MLVEPIVEKSANLVNVVYKPGRRIFHVVFGLKDPTKGFEVCCDLVKKFNVVLLEAKYTKREDEGDDWSVMIEDCGGTKMKDLRRELVSVEGMEHMLIDQDENGVMLDKYHFPLRGIGGERAYVMSAETVQKVFHRMRDLFGTGGEAMIYEEGETVGNRDVEELVEIFGREDILSRFKVMPYLYQLKGIGKPEVIRLDYETLECVFRMGQNAECEGQHSTAPYSRWVKGQLVGFMSTFFERKFTAEETKCMAMGDAYCEFLLRPK